MDDKDCEKTKLIAKLEVRQYFDHFLEVVYPKMLNNHQASCPHGKKISRVKWVLIGVSITLCIVVPTFGKTILSAILKF